MKAQTKIALRINDDNPNHHLWNNRGVWWCHVTVHKPDSAAERLRFSLKTRDIEKARGEIKASHINLFIRTVPVNRNGSFLWKK